MHKHKHGHGLELELAGWPLPTFALDRPHQPAAPPGRRRRAHGRLSDEQRAARVLAWTATATAREDRDRDRGRVSRRKRKRVVIEEQKEQKEDGAPRGADGGEYRPGVRQMLKRHVKSAGESAADRP